MTSGGGGSGELATAANQATQTTVLNTMTTVLNELNTDFGMPSQGAWSGTGNGEVIPILKAMYNQNVLIIAALNQIITNTTSG